MQNTEKTRDTWYKLDNAANIFPSVSGADNTNVFRLACTLKEPVDPIILQKALDIAMDDFPYFQVVMRRGLFWFYLERTNIDPKVEIESCRPCERIFYKNIKDLLFRVSYFQSRINLEVFHAISDGSGAFDFLRAIVYNYILIANKDHLTGDISGLDKEPPPAAQSEDSFKHYYNKDEKSSPFKTKAYTISGTLLPSGNINVISAKMPTDSIRLLAKSKGVTITAYLAALMISAIYHEMMPKRSAGKTISVTVPVDLRSHFVSESSRNFFSVVDIGYQFSKEGADFEDILKSVSSQLGEKLNPNLLSQRINYNMSVQKNIFSRFTPLFLKNIILKAAYHKAETTTTCALSNLGRITMPKPFDEYIEDFTCLLNPTRLHRWKACLCSYNDSFIINFTSCIAETKMHKYLIRHLTSAGIEVCITCNGGTLREIL